MPASHKPGVDAPKGGALTVDDLRVLIRMCDDVQAPPASVVRGRLSLGGGRLTGLSVDVELPPLLAADMSFGEPGPIATGPHP